jgi:hypothetical protein
VFLFALPIPSYIHPITLPYGDTGGLPEGYTLQTGLKLLPIRDIGSISIRLI